MAEPAADDTELLTRVAQLERQQRLVKRLGLVALAVAPITLGAFTARPDQVVRAERVELVTSQGVRHAALAADSAGVTLTLFDPRGRPTASLQLSGEPHLAILNGTGREVAGLGPPRAHLIH
jgi:hypothetical protein